MTVLAALASAIMLALAGLFALAGAAAAGASRDRLLARERAGDPRALRLDRLLADRDGLLATLRLARSATRVMGAGLAGAAGTLAAGGTGLAVALLVVLSIVLLSDAAARHAAGARSESVALRLEGLIGITAGVIEPVESGIERLALRLLREFGWTPPPKAQASPVSEEAPAANGTDRSDPTDALEELVVSDVMVHRTEMQMLDAALPVAEIVRQKLDSRFARLPVFRGAPDEIIGIVESARVVRALGPVGGDASKLTLSDILTPAWFVPDTTPVRDQLRAFLKRRTEIALVVDEYGDVMGLVTLSDIVEEIVGDITHATILDVPGVRAQPDGSYLIDGQVPIRDLNRALDWALPDEEATTVAGLVVYEARAIPQAGQTFTFYGFTFDVLRRERNRLTRLRVTPTKVARRRASAS